MCGICGIVSSDADLPVSESLLRKMMFTIRHRGPDDQGCYMRAGGTGAGNVRVGLGCTRLSIIDLVTGHQPISNEDGTVWVVLNGEVYNFQELREGLEKAGHRFATRTDTEVIVHLYEQHADDCVQFLRGMFAFALWDEKGARLLLARDRFGKKPLYYAQLRDCLIFASEIKAILQVPGVERRLDPEALDQYLTYQYVPHPLTMFAGIRKLPPAHVAVFRAGAFKTTQYWRLENRELPSRSPWAISEGLREVLAEAVRLRMIADVPIGAFLSGGIDSTIVVGLMSRLSASPVKTFTISFGEREYDESSFARIVSRRFGTEHHEFVVEPSAVEILPKLIWHYDEPFGDSSAIPTFYVSRLTAQHVKVALTGDAGDECFLGYPRYAAVKLAERYDLLPRRLRAIGAERLLGKLPAPGRFKSRRYRLKRFVGALGLPPIPRYIEWLSILNLAERRALYAGDLATLLRDSRPESIIEEQYRNSEGEFVARTAAVDMKTYLPGDLLTKMDVASMAYSLEARSPFLDHKVVEFAVNIPAKFRLKGLRGKHILKEAFADLLPREVRKRGKMGFGVPVDRWLRQELRQYAQDILLGPTALQRGYFRPETVEELLTEHMSGLSDHSAKLWALLIFELWHRKFLDSSTEDLMQP